MFLANAVRDELARYMNGIHFLVVVVVVVVVVVEGTKTPTSMLFAMYIL